MFPESRRIQTPGFFLTFSLRNIFLNAADTVIAGEHVFEMIKFRNKFYK